VSAAARVARPAKPPRRCLLFVPGSRPERFAKAVAADPDQVCIDLEDAVGPDDKDRARAAALDWLSAAPQARSELGLRINPPSGQHGRRDLQALAEAGFTPAFVMLPKVEQPQTLVEVAAALAGRGTRLIAQIESPRGLLDARAIAAAHPGAADAAGQRTAPWLSALMFGGFDYAVALRGAAGWDSFLLPRSQLACVAADAGLDFIDAPYLDFRDHQGLASETGRVIALGATAKAAIHPDQVAVIQRCFLPSAMERDWAQRVVAALEAAAGAAVQIDGKLIDRPVALAAERTLALATLGLR